MIIGVHIYTKFLLCYMGTALLLCVTFLSLHYCFLEKYLGALTEFCKLPWCPLWLIKTATSGALRFGQKSKAIFYVPPKYCLALLDS